VSLPALELAMLLAGMPGNYGGTAPAVHLHGVAPAPFFQEYALPMERAEAVEAGLPAGRSDLLPEEPPGSPPPDAPAPVTEQPAPGVDRPPRSPPPDVPAPGNDQPVPGIDQQEIVVTGQKGVPGDPIRQVNAVSFAATEAIDQAVIGPVALAYAQIVPRPVRSGVRNFLHNLHEPVVFVNFLLQLKPGKAAETLGRFAINSTIGIGGLIDVAKRRPFHLPLRRNGFADTLGYYGVRPGPYLFLPLIGPTNPRDLVGLLLDRMVLPVSVGHFRAFKSFKRFTGPLAVMKVLDHRAEFDEQLQQLRMRSDPYAARRDFYLQRRQAEIDGLRGRHSEAANPAPGLDDLRADPESPPDHAETPR
jgi:phospholipid-binding lipoprotein MlaA